jgi:hypothetical protein
MLLWRRKRRPIKTIHIEGSGINTKTPPRPYTKDIRQAENIGFVSIDIFLLPSLNVPAGGFSINWLPMPP